MDIENALVSKIVATGQLDLAVTKGIKPEHFADEEVRDVYVYLLQHTRVYKSPPSMEVVEEDWPKFEFEYVEDSLEFVIDRFIKLVKRRLANKYAVELAKACEDPKRSENIDLEFLEVSRELATVVPSTQVHRFSDMDKRLKEYELRAKEDKPTGIPFGYPQLDEWTGGIQSYEFGVISGFSSVGKSTMLHAVAFNQYASGFTPLIISLEMEAKALLRKFDAMAASLDYYKLKQLHLEDEQLDNWRETAKQIREGVQDILIIDNIRHCTPDHVFAETVRHKPDIVIVDYLSLMKSSNPRAASLWQGLTEITQELKQNARTLHIPILAAAQTNRQGGKDGAELDNIGYSLSVVQDADIVIGLFADEDMKLEKEMEVRLNKNRDGRLGKFKTIWDHENMIFREETGRDYFNRKRLERKKEEDDDDE